jgi:transposase
MVKSRLTEAEKVFILTNYNFKSIGSEQLHRSRSTIYSFYMRWLNSQTIQNRKPGGRPRKLNDRDHVRILRHVKGHPETTLRLIQTKLKIDCSLKTISKILHENKYRNFVMKNKPNISKVNMTRRLAFANEHRDWGVKEWSKILFTDECSVEVGQRYKKKVWRKRGEAMNPGIFFKSNQKFVKKYHKVWGCFSMKGPGALVFV